MGNGQLFIRKGNCQNHKISKIRKGTGDYATKISPRQTTPYIFLYFFFCFTIEKI